MGASPTGVSGNNLSNFGINFNKVLAMKQAFITMLTMQDKMNRKVHPQWVDQQFEWYRAIWLECGELIEHHGYKWWKKQTPDMDQVKLEVVDIWHFGMSVLFQQGQSIEQIAEQIEQAVSGHQSRDLGVLEATEALAADTLNSRGFSVPLFWDLLQSVAMDFDDLYRQYVGKNVLNFFRQDHGYKDGTYIKLWQGREDNEHLVEILADLNSDSSNYGDQVYQSLQQRYQQLTA
jgi:dimeric dUTPase (all-alpha-NTP-PPase superfamily)